MDQKSPLIIHFLALLLLSSFLLPLEAVPLSKRLALKNQGATAAKDSEQEITRETLMKKGVFVNRRMNIELNDYPVSGANSRHDPKTPGRP